MEREIFDVDGNVLRRVRVQNVEPIITEVSRSKSEAGDGFTKERQLRRVGEIPMILVAEMFSQGVNPFQKGNERAVLKWLDENNKFRTTDTPVSWR